MCPSDEYDDMEEIDDFHQEGSNDPGWAELKEDVCTDDDDDMEEGKEETTHDVK